MAITPGGRVGDSSSLAKPGYKGKRKLSDYEREIAHALMRKGHSKSRAIAIARGLLNHAAATGRWGRKGKASPAVRAGAAASIAQRHSFSEEHSRGTIDLSVFDLDPETARLIDLAWTEALHPRDWRGKFIKGTGLKGPLTEKGRVAPTKPELARYAVHVRQADRKIIEHMDTHSTHVTHGKIVKGPDGSESIEFDPERAKLQRKIVDTVYRKQSATAKAERKALFLGGLPGAGKSTSIGTIPGLNQSDYVTVNPDLFKEELAKRGLVPKVAGLTPLEASAFVHEESSRMALMLAERARRDNKNILWDITMNKAGSVESRLKPLNESGYKSQAVFVDIPFEMSQKRVEQRHQSGHLAFLRDTTGTHLGQRLVPSSHVATGRSKNGTSSANRDAFEQVKHRFDAFKVFDNSGQSPSLLQERGHFAP